MAKLFLFDKQIAIPPKFSKCRGSDITKRRESSDWGGQAIYIEASTLLQKHRYRELQLPCLQEFSTPRIHINLNSLPAIGWRE